MRKTPLNTEHSKLGGKLIDFGGWELPVQYSGIIQEHLAVRTTAGLFDVSHMGEVTVKGPRAEEFIQAMITNDISRMQDNRVMYSLMCYPNGGVVDDLLVYKYNNEYFLLVVNAGNTDKDFAWLEQHIHPGVELINVSDQYAQLALQGPLAEAVLQKLTKTDLSLIRFFRFQSGVDLAGVSALVSRTGYTGEDGFEIYLAAADAVHVWQKILEAGEPLGVVPIGLGARDTLRFEVGLPLYGHEISADISPLEAGFHTFVKLGKSDFMGRDALLSQTESGIPRKLVGFKMLDKGVPRGGYDVYADGEQIGFVTTGSYAPSLKQNVGLALVTSSFSGNEIDIMVRGKGLKAHIVPTPLYTKNYKK